MIIRILVVLISYSLTFISGFLFCSILTNGKVADLYDKLREYKDQLREYEKEDNHG